MAAPQHVRILVVGGGNGGIALAARLHRQGVRDVAIVEPKTTHTYRPLLTYVGAGLADPAEARRPQQEAMPRGVRWIRDRVTALDPSARTVTLADGGTLGYDHVVICAGSTPDLDAVPGVADAVSAGWATSNYVEQLAPRTWELIRAFRSGHAVFTIPDGPAPCPQAGQKILHLACDYWQRLGVLDDITVTLVTPTHGPVGIPAVDREVQPWIERYGIRVLDRAAARSLDVAARTLTVDREGTTDHLPVDLLHHTPVHAPPPWVAAAGLGQHEGYVDVDPGTLRHRHVPTVWACGDAADAACSRSGGALRHQTAVLARNLEAALAGEEPPSRYDGYSVTPVTVERGRALLAEYDRDLRLVPSVPGLPFIRPRRWLWHVDRRGLPALYWRAILRGR